MIWKEFEGLAANSPRPPGVGNHYRLGNNAPVVFDLAFEPIGRDGAGGLLFVGFFSILRRRAKFEGFTSTEFFEARVGRRWRGGGHRWTTFRNRKLDR